MILTPEFRPRVVPFEVTGDNQPPNFTGYSDIAVMPDGSVGILHDRGDLHRGDTKKNRYDEVGFVVVPSADIGIPLTSTYTKVPME